LPGRAVRPVLKYQQLWLSIKAAAKQGDFENYIGVSSLEGESSFSHLIFNFEIDISRQLQQFMVESPTSDITLKSTIGANK